MDIRNPTVLKLAKQIPGFGASGVASLSTNMMVTALLHDGLGLRLEWAYLGGYSSALVVSFLICRHLIFKATDTPRVRQFVFYFASSLSFRGLEYLASLAIQKQSGHHYLVPLFIVAVISFFIKFFYYRATVFRERRL